MTSSWKALGWKSWIAVCLIVAAGAAIWLSDSKDVDRAGVVLGAVVASLAALFAFLQLDAAKQQLRTAETNAETQSDCAQEQLDRAQDQLEEARNLVTETRKAVETAQRQHDLARKVAEGQALFAVDAALAQYEHVRAGLTPSGALDPEVLQLRYYMAVFERLGVLLDRGVLSPETVDGFYGSRLKALLDEGRAGEIVKRDREGWASFLSLWQTMRAETQRPLPDPPSPDPDS